MTNFMHKCLIHLLQSSTIESRWGRDFPPVQTGPRGPPSLLYNGYRVFPGGKVRSGRAADHSPPSSAEVLKGQSYTSTPPLGHNQACNGVTLILYYDGRIHEHQV